jgi:hypothetical protein
VLGDVAGIGHLKSALGETNVLLAETNRLLAAVLAEVSAMNAEHAVELRRLNEQLAGLVAQREDGPAG